MRGFCLENHVAYHTNHQNDDHCDGPVHTTHWGDTPATSDVAATSSSRIWRAYVSRGQPSRGSRVAWSSHMPHKHLWVYSLPDPELFAKAGGTSAAAAATKSVLLTTRDIVIANAVAHASARATSK